jgi:hypothetical protein
VTFVFPPMQSRLIISMPICFAGQKLNRGKQQVRYAKNFARELDGFLPLSALLINASRATNRSA